jgi:hypothetical protein
VKALTFHPDADDEISEAAQYYEVRKAGLGSDFLGEVEQGLNQIEGDHFVYVKEGVPRPVVIPDWKEVPVFIIKNNLRTAGLSRVEYFSLLE